MGTQARHGEIKHTRTCTASTHDGQDQGIIVVGNVRILRHIGSTLYRDVYVAEKTINPLPLFQCTPSLDVLADTEAACLPGMEDMKQTWKIGSEAFCESLLHTGHALR